MKSPGKTKTQTHILRGLSLHVVRLRERLENSNYILLRIPIEIHLLQRGLQGIFMDPGRLPALMGLSEQDIDELLQAGLVHPRSMKPPPEDSMDSAGRPPTSHPMPREGAL